MAFAVKLVLRFLYFSAIPPFAAKMSVTVTIHSGELKQIKRLIESAKKKTASKNGKLYGLWTHSNQPVIQYVTGDPKGGEDITKFLRENHGLRHVGNWSTKEFEGKEIEVI